MLSILATHPIQYHVPLWQLLARDGRVPFEVWYLSEHATRSSRDREFQQNFAWDLEMLKGYPHRFLKTPPGATPNTPFRSRVSESLPDLFQKTGAKVLWVQGWQVAAYWQAVWAARRAGVQVWMRGESNAMREHGAHHGEFVPAEAGRTGGRAGGAGSRGVLKRTAKRILLEQLFKRVDHFLCIGSANRELYRSYGVPESKLHLAPYAVDNARFARQADAIRDSRFEIRNSWKIPGDAFCVLFCGKFIPKKRPLDLIKAAQLLLNSHPEVKAHLLLAGSGELGAQMRAECDVVFDAEAPSSPRDESVRLADSALPAPSSGKPPASFTGFLNQTEISRAYVVADVLVLPSDYGETWGLVVNEAMASGVPCIISDRCGCAPDLGSCNGNSVFQFGNIKQLGDQIADLARNRKRPPQPPSFDETVKVIEALYSDRNPVPGAGSS